MITLDEIEQFRTICQTVLDIEIKPGSMLSYAQAYARAGLKMTDLDEIYIQLMYIQSNLSTWRGEQARSVKKELEKFKKQLKRREA